jgi:hypothetical protein
MAAAIHAVASLDAKVCIEAARTRFPAERMVQRYFEMYERVGATANRASARAAA